MHGIKIIAAVDRNWGIGYENKLLFHLKEDMRRFRDRTVGNIVVMGRKTLDSLPGGRPLPERENIVLTRKNLTEIAEKVRTYGGNLLFMNSVQEVLKYAGNEVREVYIIGGEEIYREFIGYAEEAFITKVGAEKKADVFFPDLDRLPEWEKSPLPEKACEDGIRYEFVTYCKRSLL